MFHTQMRAEVGAVGRRLASDEVQRCSLRAAIGPAGLSFHASCKLSVGARQATSRAHLDSELSSRHILVAVPVLTGVKGIDKPSSRPSRLHCALSTACLKLLSCSVIAAKGHPARASNRRMDDSEIPCTPQFKSPGNWFIRALAHG